MPAVCSSLQRHPRAHSTEALRDYLGFNVLERVWARSHLSEDEAMRLAVAETHAVRRERRATRGS